MNEFNKNIHDCFIEKGIAGNGWRTKVVSKEIIGRSDFAKVLVEVYKPKKRKPCIAWELCINIARKQIYWDKSTFANLD